MGGPGSIWHGYDGKLNNPGTSPEDNAKINQNEGRIRDAYNKINPNSTTIPRDFAQNFNPDSSSQPTNQLAKRGGKISRRGTGGQLMPHDRGGEIDQRAKTSKRSLGGMIKNGLDIASIMYPQARMPAMAAHAFMHREGGRAKHAEGGKIAQRSWGGVLRTGLQLAPLFLNEGGRAKYADGGDVSAGASSDPLQQMAEGLSHAAQGAMALSQQMNGGGGQAAGSDQGMDQSADQAPGGAPHRRGGRAYAAGGAAKFRRGEYY
jgi:hypothetical protein